MKKRGPWKIINSKVVYQNPWIRVEEDAVIRPDGKPGIFGVVSMIPGISVVPMDEKEHVYLTQEFHYAVGRVTIEAISGGIDIDESRLNAAKRELKEETGMSAKKWIYLGAVDPFTTVIKSPNYIYLAKGLIKGQSKLEGTEKIKVIRIPYKKALHLLKNNKITHSATVVALLKIKEYIK